MINQYTHILPRVWTQSVWWTSYYNFWYGI